MKNKLDKRILYVLLFFIFLSLQNMIADYPYQSAKTCKNCHAEIYSQWSNSMHASSISNQVFEAAFLQALAFDSGMEKEYCLSCHSPTTFLTKDYDLNLELSKEGVTCDFCHTISGITTDEKIEYLKTPGNVKFGKSKKQIQDHGLEYSEVFEKSEFCGGCHDLYNSYGVAVMSTYTEWKNSAYYGEKQCQDCHMSELNNVKSHRFAGGHFESKVKTAAEVEIEVERRDNVSLITVYVTNKGSGHKIPTGQPMRKAILHVRVKDNSGNLIFEGERVYAKILVDEKGEQISDDFRAIIFSTKILQDTRINPKEKRRETFEVQIPEDVKEYYVEAFLEYSYNPVVLTPTNMSLKMAEDSEKIEITKKIEQKFSISNFGFLIILLFSIIVVAMLYELFYK